MGITTDHGQTFSRIDLPIGQMYHVATDNRMPYWIYSNRQDDGTMRGRSDSPVAVANVPSYAPRRRLGGRGFGGGFGGGQAPVPWDQGIGGCESGLHDPRSGRSGDRLVELLRQQVDAVRSLGGGSRGRSARG